MSKALMFNFSLVKKMFFKLIALYLAVGVFIGVCMQNANVAIGITCVVGPFFGMYALFSYDAKNKWDRYCAVLPFGRAEYVVGRCLCVVLCTVASAVVAALLGVAFVSAASLMPLASEFVVPENATVAACVAVLATAAVLLSTACSLPLLFKFGLSKAIRFVPAAAILLVLLLIVGVPALVDCLIPGLNWDYLLVDYVSFTVVVAVVCAVLFAVSAAVSVKLFRRREL